MQNELGNNGYLYSKAFTLDNEEIVFAHEEPISNEELEEFEKFTLRELKILLYTWGYTSYRV